MNGSTQPWRTLREWLDGGGDPSIGWDGWHGLVQFLCTACELQTPAARAEQATRDESWAQTPLEHVQAIMPSVREEDLLNGRRGLAWGAEILRDPALEARVRALIPDKWKDLATEDRDLWRRPFPITVATIDGSRCWYCYSCGQAFDLDVEAIIITDRGGEPNSCLEGGDLPCLEGGDLHYCRECIAMALAVYDATAPADRP